MIYHDLRVIFDFRRFFLGKGSAPKQSKEGKSNKKLVHVWQSDWKFQTQKQNSYFDSLSTDEEKEAAAELLAMLFFDVIRLAMIQSKSNEAIDAIWSHKKEFKKILKPLLLPDDEVKNFLKECDSANGKVLEFEAKKNLIDLNISAIENWFTNNYDALNQKYYEHFAHIQQELSQFVNRWEDCGEDVANQVQIIIKKLQLVRGHLTTLDLKAKKLGKELLIEEAKLHLMLAECSEVIDKVLTKGVK